MLEQYVNSIFEINNEIKNVAAQGDFSKIAALVEKKKEMINKIKGAIYVRISKMSPDSIKALAEVINNLKKETIVDLNSDIIDMRNAIINWAFSKEEIIDMRASYDDLYDELRDITIGAGENTITIAGTHEFLDDDRNFRKVYNALSSINGLSKGAIELLKSCLIRSHSNDYTRYSLGQSKGILEALERKIEESNYEGITSFYESLDEFHALLADIKPSSTDDEFITEDSDVIYNLYEYLKKIDYVYFDCCPSECADYQLYHCAKFLPVENENGQLQVDYKYKPTQFSQFQIMKKEDLKKLVIKSFIDSLKQLNLLGDFKDSDDLGAYLETHKEENNYESLINVYKVLASDELYDNYKDFQDMIRCSFQSAKMSESMHINNSFFYSNRSSHTDYLPFMETLFDNLEENLSTTFVDNLKKNGVSNLISKSDIYDEIISKYVSILNDIQRKTNRKDNDNRRIRLISATTGDLKSSANYFLRLLAEDYESLKTIVDKLKYSIEFERRFHEEHSRSEIEENDRLGRTQQLDETFGIKREENYDALADVLASSNSTKTR